LLLWRAATSLDTNIPDAPLLCAMAKRFATDAGFEVANICGIRVHSSSTIFRAWGRSWQKVSELQLSCLL
jgi:alkylation response protein AidB-like acyl-CoA dehydrogenase